MGHRATGAVGRDAEQRAFRYLLERGFRPIARNFRCRGGEIDLIMLDGDCLTFVEVRYRSSSAFAAASDTVDRHKQKKIIRTAATFLTKNTRFANFTMRFDVIAVEGVADLTVQHIADAFRPIPSTSGNLC
jgi:putative endonuclease